MSTFRPRASALLVDGRVLDAVIAVALTVLSQAQLPADEVWWVRLSMLTVLALAVRRRWPLATTCVLAAGVAVQGFSADPPSNFGLFLAIMLASFTVASECALGRAVLGGGTLVAGIVAHDVSSAAYGTAAGMASDLAIPVILWFVGRGVRFQRGRADRASDLLARLEADQEELARLAVTAERQYLARELHDVVTHSVTVAVIQAQGAQRALVGDQPLVTQALADIETAGRSALTEMRRLLGVLREEESAGTSARAPGLADLPALVEMVRGAGLEVSLAQAGTPGPLDPAVELTAYRVVQEALTNALRHSTPARVDVELAWADGELALDVVDSGTGPSPARPDAAEPASAGAGGRGLIGLQERVAAHGGTLRSGLRREGGYQVTARLPVLLRMSDETYDGTNVRVVLADDHQLVRTGFRLILDGEPGIVVVGDAADGRAAVEAVQRLRPDVVLMDVRMPVLDGLAATRALAADPQCTSRVVVLTTFDDDEYVFAALEAGASGYLLKDTPAHQLVSAIRIVAAGESILSPTVTTRLVRDIASRRRDPDAAQRVERLSAREREVLAQLAEGLSNNEIAAALVLSEATVKTHVAHILTKLGARDRVQAVVTAYRSGLAT